MSNMRCRVCQTRVYLLRCTVPPYCLLRCNKWQFMAPTACTWQSPHMCAAICVEISFPFYSVDSQRMIIMYSISLLNDDHIYVSKILVCINISYSMSQRLSHIFLKDITCISEQHAWILCECKEGIFTCLHRLAMKHGLEMQRTRILPTLSSM